MGAAPSEYTVASVDAEGKITVAGFAQALGVSPKQPVSVGQTLKGWLNPTGQYGPYLKVAEERGSSGGGSRGGTSPGRERSIERQVALKAAVELLAVRGPAITPNDVIESAQVFDDFLAASARSGENSSPRNPAGSGAPNGADTGAPSFVQATDDGPDF